MVASLLAMGKGVLPASLNYEHPDPECPVNVVHGETRPIQKKALLLLNQGRAGQAVATTLVAE
jgi:3-oxoacyl-(acyl-carrier-protein) synthase